MSTCGFPRGRYRRLGASLVSLLIVGALIQCCCREPDGGACRPRAATAPQWQIRVGNSIGADPRSVVTLWVLPVADFLRPGSRVTIAGEPSVIQPGRSERLCFRSAEGSWLVRSPDDLSGHVQILSGRAALRYVRLFTSPATVHCLEQPWWMEVVPRSVVDEDLLFGRYAALCRPPVTEIEWPSGLGGVLANREWARNGLQPAEVHSRTDAFVVRRMVFRVSPARPRTNVAYEVEETVSPSGEWHRVVLREVGLGPTTLSAFCEQ